MVTIKKIDLDSAKKEGMDDFLQVFIDSYASVLNPLPFIDCATIKRL